MDDAKNWKNHNGEFYETRGNLQMVLQVSRDYHHYNRFSIILEEAWLPR